MPRSVQLNELDRVLSDLSYPVTNDQAKSELGDVTIDLADGQVNFGELLTQSTVSEFDSPTDIQSALHNVLPREAVGEPYQSEGEG